MIRLYESLGAFSESAAERLITVNYPDSDYLLAIRINDDSMENYKLAKGSIAVVRTKGLVMSGMIALVSINHQTPKIAKVSTDDRTLTLSFGSKKYPEEKYDLRKNVIDIIGKVIGFMGDIG